jgi:hypothetical protein
MPGIRRLVVPLAIATLGVAVLSGCVPTSTPTPGASDSSANPSVSSTPSPTPTASATAAATPITIGCSTLITPDDMYAFNPNFGLLTAYTPAAGSAAASAKAQQGIACRWSNQSSGDNIDISVAHLSAPAIVALKDQAVQTATLVPTYGDEAYFATKNGVGTATVFQGNYWLVATSVDFLEPGDPADLINAALSALK